MVLHALSEAWGGEIFVPKIPSYRIVDVAEAIGPECEQLVVGIRPGEKIHEEMITASDSFNTVDVGGYYVILPQTFRYTKGEYMEQNDAKAVPPDFTYSSGTNEEWLSVEDIRSLIATHLYPGFSIHE